MGQQRRMSAKQSARSYVYSLIKAFQNLGPDAPGVVGPWRVSGNVWAEMQKTEKFVYSVPYRQMWVFGMSTEELNAYRAARTHYYKFELVTLLGQEVYRVKISKVEK